MQREHRGDPGEKEVKKMYRLLPGLSAPLSELRKLLLPSSLILPLSRRALKLPSLALILPHLCGLEELLLFLSLS
jgi:hypothetical protein